MKALRIFFLPLLLVTLIPTASQADEVDDLKEEVARILPAGSTHQDKVRQFLKVRKYKVIEQPKEKTITGRLVTKKGFKTVSELVVVFEFDDAGLIKDVRYPSPKTGS